MDHKGRRGGFIRIQSELQGRGLTIQCEHSNCGLWFYIADDLPVQYELELTNNFSKIEQGMHSFQGAGTWIFVPLDRARLAVSPILVFVLS